ncbi:uncharacterized protein LOC126291918 [Schistocerca gregaria]|uniref:uncharacterized protein LOC126291816 n=1 Tax=Schistocerca gregaria TaxID=7010 RepID=UPI00211DA9B9|nr:uncharacterized protein LOC126291816 [Schistocerca gregaria]XP_049841609.1 uncharacterized protein LOC126291918 [Schistocerca gregaria]
MPTLPAGERIPQPDGAGTSADTPARTHCTSHYTMRRVSLWLLVLGVGVLGAVAEGPVPYPGVPLPPPSVDPGAPYTHYAPADPGFTFQTGYEGFLVPVEQQLHSLLPPGPWSAFTSVFLHFLPKFGLKLIGTVGLWLLGFSLVVLLGGGFTVAVCTFTPLCTLTFLGFPFGRAQVRESVRAFLEDDRLTQAAAFVTEALDKYAKMNAKAGKSLGEKANALDKEDKKKA